MQSIAWDSIEPLVRGALCARVGLGAVRIAASMLLLREDPLNAKKRFTEVSLECKIDSISNKWEKLIDSIL